MPPILSIVGRSHSGKTTLIEKLIKELKEREYRVAVIKHSREDIDIDQEGKDTWRFSQVGSEVVVIASAHKLAIIKPMEHDLTPQELSQHIQWDYDLLLTEGFKTSNMPKIEVHVKEQGNELLTPPEQLLAVATDTPLELDVPQFTRDDIKGVADVIEGWLQRQPEEDDLELFVNRSPVALNGPVKNLLARTILAMVSGLKGVKEIKSLQISLRRKP